MSNTLLSNAELTTKDKDTLIELICNEQMRCLNNKEYKTDTYLSLEKLKIKIKTGVDNNG